MDLVNLGRKGEESGEGENNLGKGVVIEGFVGGGGFYYVIGGEGMNDGIRVVIRERRERGG